MKIKLYDVIGIKSGMNFYLEAFYRLLDENDIQAEIISNFSHDNRKQQLPNIFEKSRVKKIVNLLRCYFKLISSMLRLKKDEYIVILVYGVVLDIPLFLLAKLSKRVILDIHEIMALDYKNPTLRKILHYLYRTCPNKVISHSEKTSNTLSQLSLKSQILVVPLFNYYIDVNYDMKNIGKDIIDAFNDNATYFLCFGNIRPSKGIFDLLAATHLVKDKNIKIIVAGQDIFNKMDEYAATYGISDNVTLILKFINDDEMKFLFTKSQMTLLPYENISQSAVLESAVNFRIPLLTSDIVYFKTILSEFPSFGVCTNTKDPEVFANSIDHFAKEDLKREFYSKADVEKYRQKDKFDAFVKELKAL